MTTAQTSQKVRDDKFWVFSGLSQFKQELNSAMGKHEYGGCLWRAAQSFIANSSFLSRLAFYIRKVLGGKRLWWREEAGGKCSVFTPKSLGRTGLSKVACIVLEKYLAHDKRNSGHGNRNFFRLPWGHSKRDQEGELQLRHVQRERGGGREKGGREREKEREREDMQLLCVINPSTHLHGEFSVSHRRHLAAILGTWL